MALDPLLFVMLYNMLYLLINKLNLHYGEFLKVVLFQTKFKFFVPKLGCSFTCRNFCWMLHINFLNTNDE